MKSPNASLARASTSFSQWVHVSMERLPNMQPRSLAWIARHLSDRYVAEVTAEGGDARTKEVRGRENQCAGHHSGPYWSKRTGNRPGSMLVR
jgi:hypothetical protein